MEIGERIGDYEILGILGAGGMGQVYKVRNVISDRVEAMKVLLPNLESDPELGDRFLREIKVQASLEHPNIAALRTAQKVGNSILMVMEYVEGRTMEAVLKDGPLPVEKAIEYAAQVLDALDYAHKRGVIHRDIKPANMMLTPTGTVKLMDFGIARLVADERLTQTGRTVGSLYYMSPEQIRGEATLDARADIYSFGIALYEMTTGRRPFEGDSAYSVMAAHLQQTPPPPVELDPRLPPGLNDIILMAIAKDPAKRFQTAGAMRAALLRLKGGVAQPAAPNPAVAVAAGPAVPQPQAVAAITPSVSPAPSRRWLWVTAGSLATIAVLAVAALQIPKWRGAGAASVPVLSPPISEAIPPAQPQPEASPAASSAQPAAAVEPPKAASQIPAAPAAPLVRPPVQRAVPAPVPQAQPAQPPAALAPAPAATQQAQQPVQPPQATPPAPRPDPGHERGLSEARQRLMLMAARVSAVKSSMANLQRKQAASGLGMRGDMLSAHQRMEFHLDEAERLLKGGDAAAAKRSLDAAERELEKLEAWLGH